MEYMKNYGNMQTNGQCILTRAKCKDEPKMHKKCDFAKEKYKSNKTFKNISIHRHTIKSDLFNVLP